MDEILDFIKDYWFLGIVGFSMFFAWIALLISAIREGKKG